MTPEGTPQITPAKFISQKSTLQEDPVAELVEETTKTPEEEQAEKTEKTTTA